MVAENNELTTQRAANILGVSRPFLVRLLEEDKVPFHMVGSHRRLHRGSEADAGRQGQNLTGSYHITHMEATLREHFPEAWIEGFEALVPQWRTTRKTVMSWPLPSTARLVTIVTYNLRDFPMAATKPWRVSAIGPSAFLKRLYRKDEALVIGTLHEQASELRRTFDAQLKVLLPAAPAFVEMVCRDTGVKL